MEVVVPTQTQISAEQWLTVPKADSIKCTATSSYGILSANVDLEEAKNAGWAGDYVTLKEYYGKALTTDTSVLTTQTATSGAANSIKIYGTATDSSGTYSVDTPLKGISSRKATFQGLSETASAGSATQVEQEEHLHGSFTSMATYTPISGTPETKTRSSNYGTEYDLTMLAKKDASGPATWGTMSYYINPSRDLSAAATLDLNNAALVALRAANSQYVYAESSGGEGVVANGDSIGPWETFDLINLGNNKYAFQAVNGQYVCAENGGGSVVVANRDAIGPWETFGLIDLGNGRYGLQAANGQYVCAEGGGGYGLVANRNAISAWETFNLVDQTETPVALRANNGQYVCAEDGGLNQDLYANRNAMGDWEKFQLIELGDNKVALKGVNGKYLCAENGGGGSIVPNRDWIGPWETFERTVDGSGGWAFRASNGQLLCAENGGGDKVLANRNAIGPWETFSLEALGIQEAIDTAQPGDGINMAAGTYRENVDIQKSLDIRGAGAGNTIVDSQQAGSVFTIGNQINSQVKVGLSDLTIQNGTGTSTIVHSEVPNFNPELGGGVLNFADLTITSATISGNTAAAGGGVFNYRGIVNLEKSIITGNKAVAGAGIVSHYGYVNMNGGSIDHNDAAMVRDLNPYLGDLDRIAGSENIKLADDIVAKLNQAGVPIVRNNITAGGGIASYKSTVNLNGGSIDHNSAIIGGGIASYGSSLNLKEGTIAQNNAAIGGGVAAILGVTNQSGGSIAYNEAAIGGGIAAYGDAVNLNGGSISSNTATTGGGAAAYYSLISLNGSSISGNEATGVQAVPPVPGFGGGILNYNGTVSLISGSVDSNMAHFGGGIYSHLGVVSGDESIVHGNIPNQILP